jgi:uncharacterized protein YdgA (DUF945 family)
VLREQALIKKIGIAAVAVVVAYVAGSYFVGYRAEQMLHDMMANAQAQSDDAIQWENVQTRHGVFTSTGSATMIYEGWQIEQGQPVKIDIDYTIHHALGFSHIAHYLWSATPTDALARAMTPVYTTAPRLSGDGHMYWSGQTTSSIHLPGVNQVQTELAVVSFDPLVGEVTSRKNAFDLTLGLAQLDIVDREDASRLQINGLAYHAHSTDLASGSATLQLNAAGAELTDEFGQAQSLRDYQWLFQIEFVDDVLSFDMTKSAAALLAYGAQVDGFEFGLGIDGLHREDLRQFARLMDRSDEQGHAMTPQQQEELQRVAASMLAKGLVLRVPVLQGDVRLMGSDVAQTFRLRDLSFDAQVTDLVQGVGHLRLGLGQLVTPQALSLFLPSIEGFELDLKNTVTNGHALLEFQKRLAHYEQFGQTVSDVQVQAMLGGVAAADLSDLVDLLWISGGDPNELYEAQAERLAEILHNAITYGLTFEVPRLTASATILSDEVESLDMQGFRLSAKLDDADTLAGRVQVTLEQLKSNGPLTAGIPQVSGFDLVINNQVVEGRATYTLQKSAKAFKNEWLDIEAFDLVLSLTGLPADDVVVLASLLEGGMNSADQQRTAQALRNAIELGFELDVPTWKVSLDGASLDGQIKLTLDALDGAPLSDFDLNRLATIDLQLGLEGQSAWLDPFVAQGVAFGLVQVDGDQAQAQMRFANGQLDLNGQTLPADEFVTLGNGIIQMMLVDTQ